MAGEQLLVCCSQGKSFKCYTLLWSLKDEILYLEATLGPVPWYFNIVGGIWSFCITTEGYRIVLIRLLVYLCLRKRVANSSQELEHPVTVNVNWLFTLFSLPVLSRSHFRKLSYLLCTARCSLLETKWLHFFSLFV